MNSMLLPFDARKISCKYNCDTIEFYCRTIKYYVVFY
uniref:Uncharacterized protein n=1 Tax=Heterorhabditis bacteriophora TaxID=37862 RepID=A0A1I7W8G6_HETBA